MVMKLFSPYIKIFVFSVASLGLIACSSSTQYGDAQAVVPQLLTADEFDLHNDQTGFWSYCPKSI